jgi:hypothetical protein
VTVFQKELLRETYPALVADLGDVHDDVRRVIRPLAEEVPVMVHADATNFVVTFERVAGSPSQMGKRVVVLTRDLGENIWRILTVSLIPAPEAHHSRTGGATCGLHQLEGGWVHQPAKHRIDFSTLGGSSDPDVAHLL